MTQNETSPIFLACDAIVAGFPCGTPTRTITHLGPRCSSHRPTTQKEN